MAGSLIGNSVAFRTLTEAIAMVAPVDSAPANRNVSADSKVTAS